MDGNQPAKPAEFKNEFLGEFVPVNGISFEYFEHYVTSTANAMCYAFLLHKKMERRNAPWRF